MHHHLNHAIISQVQIDYTHQPVAVFLLGANGSGKSSLRSYLDLSDIQTNIDPDALNRIAKYRAKDNYLMFASKQAIRLFNHALRSNLNVCMESTLSGQSAMNRIKVAKNHGYYVIAYFVGLSSVELNIERVRQRVLKGGHNIPNNLIVKRYQNSIDNLLHVYYCLDELHVIDNTQSHYELQFTRFKEKLVKYDVMRKWANSVLDRLKVNNKIFQ
jgi:predicted ABC-type ATPase